MASFADVVSTFCPASGSPATTPAGLFVSGSEKSVPLRIRTVNSTVHCDTSFADTTETFAFIADEDVSVVFKFPLPTRSAVYKLEATVGDKTIVTEVKPKQEAQAEFTQAVNQGNTAVIAKQEDASQIFTLELGNLEAMQEAIVTLSYLRVLDSVGGALEWVHTATWTPPYLGSAGDQARGPQAALDQNPRFATKVAYSLAYDIKLLSSRGFKAVESPEPVTVADVAEGPLSCKHVTLSEQISDPSKDLTLLVELQPLDAAHYAASTANGYGQVSTQRTARPGPAGSPPRTKTFALATFVPRPLLTTTDSSTSAPLHQELILIVDCSGSMYGQRIDQARDAAIYFIKDLPANRGIRFNIVLFGSNHVLWQPSCQDFNQATMTSAVEWVRERCHADMGGTEMVATFQAVYAMPVTQGYTRQIIFLTDGGISSGEEQDMCKIVSAKGTSAVGAALRSGIARLKNKVLNRQPPASDTTPSPSAHTLPTVHCLGIGHGVHRGLLDGLASRTGGVSQYVVDGESITRKAGFLSKTCLAGPSVVCAPRLSATAGVVRAVPHVLPPRLFPDQAVHMLVEVDSDQPPATLRLEGKRGDGSPWALELPVDVKTSTEGEAYHVLHTMCYVAGLLDGSSHLHTTPDGTPLPTQPAADDVKASVVAAAVSAHLVTRHTAAVGVLIQKDPLDPSKVSKVEVPLATPHGADLWKESVEGDSFVVLCSAAPLGGMHMMQCAPMACMAATVPLRAGPTPCSAGAMFDRCARAAPARAPAAAYHSMAAPCPPPPAPGGGGAQLYCYAAPELAMKRKMVKKRMLLSKESKEESKVELCAEREHAPLEGGGLRAESDAGAAVDSTCLAVSDECEEADMECESAEALSMEASKVPEAPAESKVAPSEALSQLNLLRGLEGQWAASEEVLQLVVSQVAGSRAEAVQAARAGKPAALTEEQWVTVLALAFLRKHCVSERSVWESMEGKAMGWLSGAWPQGCKAVGLTVLGAMKLV